ncbi:hypothetical protein SEA_NICEHOUSE_31 [Rhodococcus phage NiceHouse]|nr:hypothetical protein SEA_NICEHOUSE_31 [Rhodococcus phage NiceHouse]
MDDEPYEDDEDYDWFDPYPMVVYAKRNQRINLTSISYPRI